MPALVSLSHGASDRKNEERRATCAEAGWYAPENVAYRANRATLGPHDSRGRVAADSEGSLQPGRSLRLRTAEAVREIFADTADWLAIFVPGDALTAAAHAAADPTALLVTTEEVLSEFLTAVSAHGDHARRLACKLVREILDDPHIEVVAQSHESFLAGLTLYERRPDKEYSFADCISMNVMRQKRIREVLTHDRHFAQEGFVRLLDRRI